MSLDARDPVNALARLCGGGAVAVALLVCCTAVVPYDPAAIPRDDAARCRREGCGSAAECASFAFCRADSQVRCHEDTDEDGVADCEAVGCRGFGLCTEDDETTCKDGVDNDRDGAVDCAEPACAGHGACREETDAACADERDNDRDGRTDCQDADCRLTLPCLAQLPLVRDEPCTGAGARRALQDGFDTGIDEAVWELVGDPPAAWSPALPGTLEIPGLDDGTGRGLRMRRAVPVDRDRPLRAEVVLRRHNACWPVGACDECWDYEAGRSLCTLRVGLEEARDELGGRSGATLVEVLLEGAPEGQDGQNEDGTAFFTQQVRLSCHGQAATEGEATERFFYVDRPTPIGFELSPETGRIQVHFAGHRLCETAPLVEHEVEVALFAAGSGTSPRLPIYIDEVSLDVAPEPRCQGLGEPLFPEVPACTRNSRFSGVLDSPRIAYVPGWDRPYQMLLRADPSDSSSFSLLAGSSAGRRNWRPEARPLWTALEREEGVTVGGLIAWPAEGLLDAWLSEGRRAFRIRIGAERWLQQGVTRDGVEDGWIPEAVVALDGQLRGWSGDPRGDAPVIAAFQSATGLAWTSLEAAAVQPPAWAPKGLRRPAVARDPDSGVLVMAFVGGAPPAVGLAFSRDGVQWLHHVDNPVFSGDRRGLDDAGLDDVSLLVEGGVLRLWYTALAQEQVGCPEAPDLRVGPRRRIAATELRWGSLP